MLRQFFAVVIAVCICGPLAAQTGDVVSDAREIYLAGDYEAALAVLIPQADAGHPRAQNIVGASYQFGRGVPVDAVLALKYLTLSADQGYPPALHNLGYLYELGMETVPPDPVLARSFYTRSAALDYSPSQSALGGMMVNGVGGPVDLVMALRLFRRGMELGDRESISWMAWLNLQGTGMDQNLEEARRLYTIAAAMGQSLAQNALGQMFEAGTGGPQDLTGAMELYQQAIAGDDAYAGINAAWLVFENPDLFPDQIRGLAYCFWAVANASDQESADSYSQACEEVAAPYSAEDRRRAEKIAAAL